MKKIYIILWVVILSYPLAVLKAQVAGKNDFTVLNKELVKDNNHLHIGFVLDCSNLRIDSNNELLLQPALIGNKGDTLRLPYMVFPGKIRNKVNHRKARLYGEEDGGLPYKTFYLQKGKPARVEYTETVNFENWMYGSELVLLQEEWGCANCRRELAAMPLARVANQPQVAYIIPEAVNEEKRQVVVFIGFPWDQAVILPDFRNNSEELAKIDHSIETVLNNPNVMLTSINLKGYASPEGSYPYNTRLAARRTAAVGDYIREKFRPADSIMTVESDPEDWAGLRERVDSSALSNKQQVLAVIDEVSDPDARDNYLKRIDNGVTYNHLLRNIYPVLRRVDCRLGYRIEEPYTVEEIREMIQSDPGQLSLNELFLAAGSYPCGSDEFNEVFVIAGRYYPDDEIVNTNRSASALQQGDLETARMCLEFNNHRPEAWNNLGILLWEEGRIPEAEECFRDASNCGCKEAAYNLQELTAAAEKEN